MALYSHVFLAGAVLLAAGCGARPGASSSTHPRSDNALALRVPGDSSMPATQPASRSAIQSEFYSLPRPLVREYIDHPGRVNWAPGKQGFPEPAYTEMVVTDATRLYVARYQRRYLADALLPLVDDETYSGDACIVLVAAFELDSACGRKLRNSRYESPTHQGDWRAKGPNIRESVAHKVRWQLGWPASQPSVPGTGDRRG